MGKHKVSLDRDDVMPDVLFEVPPVGLIGNKGHVVAELDDETAEGLGNTYGVTVEASGAPVDDLNFQYPGYDYPEPAEEEETPPAPEPEPEPEPPPEGGETG